MDDVTAKGVLALAGAQPNKVFKIGVKLEDLDAPVADLVVRIAADFELETIHLLAEGRGTQYVAKARQALMWACHTLLSMNLNQVGEALGRDRTSVRHGVDYIEGMLQCDDDVGLYWDAFEKQWAEAYDSELDGEAEAMI